VKILIEFLVSTGMLTFFLIMPQANGMPSNSIPVDIHAVQRSAAARPTMIKLSLKTDKAVQVERTLIRDARRDKWWMAFVGITIVGYRLLRKHQALFGNSLLYGSYGSFEQRPAASIDSLTSELEPVGERLVNAS
jgi:hypothetical protein